MASGQEPIPAQVGIPQAWRWSGQPAQASVTYVRPHFVDDQEMLDAARRESQVSAGELERLAKLMRGFGDHDADTLLAHIESAGLTDE